MSRTFRVAIGLTSLALAASLLSLPPAAVADDDGGPPGPLNEAEAFALAEWTGCRSWCRR